MMRYEDRKYRLTGMTPLLGSQPAAADIRTKFVASKAPAQERGEEETDMLPALEERGLTVFLRDKDGTLSIMDYMMVGYLKEVANRMKDQLGIKQARAKMEMYAFVSPRIIPICQGGCGVKAPSGTLERSLRAQTMQGPRTTLTASEMIEAPIEAPWEIEFSIRLLDNAATKTSGKIDWDTIETVLDYGAMCGIGQWRNGGYGRFTWERIE